jgi:peptide/nickel transport system permease protein
MGLRFLARRLGHAVLLLFGVSLLSFVLAELAPGDYLSDLWLHSSISPETIAALRAQYGLDDPLPVRYLRWLGSAFRGELGYSVAYDMPVAPLLWRRALNTLLLTTTATLMSWLIAIPVGVWCANRKGRLLDRMSTVGTSLLLATPELLLGLALLVVAVRTSWLPAGGMVSLEYDQLGPAGKILDLLSHLFLPVLALVLGALPTLIRHTRAAMLEVLSSPFLQAARAHGIRRRRLLWRHALPAAANPLISLLGLSVAGLLSGSLLIEVIMSWPGVGPLLLEAIMARDIHVVVGTVMLSSLFLVSGNLLGDLLLYLADPRVRRPS